MRRDLQIAFVLALGGSLALWGHGCGEPTGDSDDRIKLLASAPQIPADGVSTVTLTAIVVNADGTPTTEGVNVIFESTGGTLMPGTAAVAAGIATTTLTSSLTPGEVTVTARTEPGQFRDDAKVMFTEATAGRIELTCSPNVIEADGISEAVCTAVVERSNGEPVANGTVVTFSTTAGTLTATSAQTTNGIATTSLRSTTTGTIATVTASSGSITVSDRVQFLDNPPTRVTLTARPRQIKADGREQSIITATVRRRDGSLAVDGTIVNCVTSDGTLSPTQLMTLDGNATTNLTSATFEARATVTCVSGTGIGTVTVNFIESSTGEVDDIRVTANPQTIRVGGQTSTITIRVLNASGGGIANEDVFLSVSGVPNVTLVPTQATTNASGQVTATLTSGVTAGQAVVAADAGAVTGTATVTILPLPASDIVNFTVPNSIVEGGSGTVSLVVVDRFGNPVDGTQVSFSITCPGGGNGDACDRVTLSTSTALTVNGFASTLVQVANGSPEVQVQIRAAVGTISRTGSITVIRGPTPTPTNTPGPTSTPTITPTPGVTPTP